MNKEVFSKFIKENIDSAYRFAYSYTRNRENAEDVVSESVLKAFDSIDSLKNPEYIKSWFFRIIINTAKNMFSWQSKFYLVESNNSDYQDSILPVYKDDHSDLNFYDILSQLPVEKRMVLILHYYEGFTLKEVSEIMNLNENTVKKRLYSSLDKLRINMEVVHNG